MLVKIANIDKTYVLKSIAVCLLGIFLIPSLPFFNPNLLIHDYLNSNVSWYESIKLSGLILSSSETNFESILGGIPRGLLPSEAHLASLLHFLFPTSWALFLNYFLVHVIAYFSFSLLGELILRKRNDNELWAKVVVQIISLSFALIPFWIPAGVSIAGQPLLVYAFLQFIWFGKRILPALIFFVFPFYSEFAFSTFFFIVELFTFYSIYIFVSKVKFNWKVLILPFVFIASWLLVDYRLISVFLEGIETNRNLFIDQNRLNIAGVIGQSVKLMAKGQYHSYIGVWPLFILSVAVFGVLLYRQKISKWVILSIVVQFVFISIDFILKSNLIASLGIHLGPLQSIQLRFYTILPVFWHISSFIAILELLRRFEILRKPIMLFGLGTVVYFASLFSVFNNDYQGAFFADNRFYSTFNSENPKYETLDSYYKVNQFIEIRARLNESGYNYNVKVACFNFSPQIAQFHGLKTVGGYYPVYPKERKMQFLEYVEEFYSLENHGYLEDIKRMGIQCFFRFDPDETKCPSFDYNEMSRNNCHVILSIDSIECDELTFMSKVQSTDNSGCSPIYIFKLK